MSVFHPFLKIFLVLSPFLLDPDPYCFFLDPDPYQSSPWIWIRNEFFTSWIRIRIKMIRIRHTGCSYRLFLEVVLFHAVPALYSVQLHCTEIGSWSTQIMQTVLWSIFS